MSNSSSFPGVIPPPPGVTADINHPQDVLRTINFVTQGLTIFYVTCFVGLRYYAKVKVWDRNWGWDDYSTFIAYIFMLGYCIGGIFASLYGGGLNQWEVRKTDIQSFFKTGYAETIFYAPMALFTKMSLLSIIARVFGPVYKKTIIGIYILMGMTVAFYVSSWVVKIRICWPIEAYWQGELDKCLDQAAVITADSTISAITDLAILLLPTPLTWSLQMPTKKKLRIIALLAAGGVATGFSVYRLIMILTEGSSSNQTIVFIKVILTGNAEVGIGLICACLPAASALILRHKRSGPSSYKNGSGHPRSHASANVKLATLNSSRSRPPKDNSSSGCDSPSQDQAELVSNAQGNPHGGIKVQRTFLIEESQARNSDAPRKPRHNWESQNHGSHRRLDPEA